MCIHKIKKGISQLSNIVLLSVRGFIFVIFKWYLKETILRVPKLNVPTTIRGRVCLWFYPWSGTGIHSALDVYAVVVIRVVVERFIRPYACVNRLFSLFGRKTFYRQSRRPDGKSANGQIVDHQHTMWTNAVIVLCTRNASTLSDRYVDNIITLTAALVCHVRRGQCRRVCITHFSVRSITLIISTKQLQGGGQIAEDNFEIS